MRNSVIVLLGLVLAVIVTRPSLAIEEDHEDEEEEDYYWDSESYETEELDADYEEGGVDNAGNNPEEKKAMEISIIPLDPNEFACLGLPDGKYQSPTRSDCLSFYFCGNGTGYKIFCPRIPQQTFYNPIKESCDDSDMNFCKHFSHDEQKGNAGKETSQPLRTEL